jgi:hypothetical protein
MASNYLNLHYHLVSATKALRPLRGRWVGAILNRWCRCAQPPANCCNASGVKRGLPRRFGSPVNPRRCGAC